MLRALLGFLGVLLLLWTPEDSHCYELYGGCKALDLSEGSPLGKLKVLRWRIISMTPSLCVDEPLFIGAEDSHVEVCLAGT